MVFASSCTINKDIMFKTPVDYAFDTLPAVPATDFTISPNDFLQFRLFANDGFRLIDLITDENQRAPNQRNMPTYLVVADGTVKLPLVGYVPLGGKTLREAELYLEGIYTQFYNRPFVQLTVVNRRVIVFPGGGGDAKVVNLDNNSSTLTEVLAQAGGLANRGNASKVKVFRRKQGGGRYVYEFDLSDISGLRYADLVMQGDDIVYVQPNPELARELLQDLTPVITLLTTTILVIGLVRSFEN
ncbi:MAG: polysaccharide biosynthesis/export family protein [Flavobacteriales bacterium]|nr:polysaccharide biosynthesis/export family protein [Flavobacteriales bacterium]